MRKRRWRDKLHNLNITDYLVFICIASINIFVIVSLYFYYKYGIEIPDIKTEIFLFFGTELMAMASIAISKNIRKKEEDEEC